MAREELYGPNQQVTLGDVPALDNGLCRVRYIPDLGVFAVDSWTGGVWLEHGRITFYRDYPATVIAPFTSLAGAQLVEWSPERAVVRADFVQDTTRLRAFLTLQRGWTGPRIDLYAHDAIVGPVGSQMYYSPNAGDQVVLFLGPTVLSSSTNDGWGSAGNPGASFLEPYIGIQTEKFGFPTVAWLPDLASQRLPAFTDVYAYLGDSFGRRALGIAARHGEQPALRGANGARLLVCQRGVVVEAEAHINVSTGITQVADAAATGGQAVQSTNTAAGGIAVNVVRAGPFANSQPPLLKGRYTLAVRARASAAGGTASFRANGGSGFTTTVTYTSTTYGWVNLGELDVTAANVTIDAWRSAGTGNVLIDRVVLIPLEMDLETIPAFDGPRDQTQGAFYDQSPAMVLIPR